MSGGRLDAIFDEVKMKIETAIRYNPA